MPHLNVKIIFLLVTIMVSPHAMSATKNISLPITTDNWRLVTDNVMGGVSSGTLTAVTKDQLACIQLTGHVSTENNGGFIQAAIDIASPVVQDLSMNDGLWLKVHGNGQPYNIHLRTSYLWLPWQAYRATFNIDGKWSYIQLPFKDFIGYKTSSPLQPKKIKRLGVVAIGREFQADLCIAEVGFYKAPA